MSTQPSTETDLDRTEELPQLDIAAYEASLTEGSISSTDTWSVQALRDATLEEDGEGRPCVSPFRSKPQRPAPDRPTDVTLDAGHILTRVAQLEAELTSAKALGEELEHRCESLGSELADQRRAAQALQADNARLSEQHSIGIDKVQALERQLQVRIADFDAEAQRLQAAHAAATAQSDAARRELEQRIVRLTEELAGLNGANARLQEELRSAADASRARAEEIEDLQDRLEDQQDTSEQMARYLAAKVVEQDALALSIEQREQSMRALQTSCDDLTEQLRRTDAQLSQATARADAAERDLILAHDERRGLDREQEQKDSEIEQARTAAAAAVARVQELETELQSAASVTLERRKQIEEFELQLADGQQQVGTLHAELVGARAKIAELDRSAAALAEVRADLNAKRDALERANERIENFQAEVEELGAQVDARTQRLEGVLAELEAARAQAAHSTPAMEGLEIALRARDELVADLRTELQTAQDERGIMAGQLEKARARNKKLAHEIFQRDKRIGTLQEDLAVHAETLAAIRQDISRVGTSEPRAEGLEPQRVLEAVGHDGAVIVLNRKVITVGRTSDNDACIPSKLVSRHHARLLVGPNAVIVEDAGSTNGCYVNDRLVKQQLMHDGDVLSLGDLRYRLRTLSAQPVCARANVVSMADHEESE